VAATDAPAPPLQIAWRDLVPLGPRERTLELLRPVPWLAGSLAAAHAGWYVPALALSFLFFLAGLRLVHDVFHHNLGLGRLTNHLVLAGLSGVMLGSMHAIRLTHLHHHRHCLGDDDVEASSARRTAWGALVSGPAFPVRLHLAAWRLATLPHRRWIAAELALTAGVLALAVGVLDLPVLVYHVAAMAAGQCLTAFFAVWTVHHDCDHRPFARTLRNRLKSAIAMDMFFHVEHHLFPRVPTCRLARLAQRLDRVAPELSRKRVY
jgi:fatty acid desaturase